MPAVGAIALGLGLVEQPDGRQVGQVAPERVDVELAEAPGQGELLVGGERLIPEEEHQVVEQGLLERDDLLVRERPPQIDARDLGTDLGRERTDPQAHASPSGRGVESSQGVPKQSRCVTFSTGMRFGRPSFSSA